MRLWQAVSMRYCYNFKFYSCRKNITEQMTSASNTLSHVCLASPCSGDRDGPCMVSSFRPPLAMRFHPSGFPSAFVSQFCYCCHHCPLPGTGAGCARLGGGAAGQNEDLQAEEGLEDSSSRPAAGPSPFGDTEHRVLRAWLHRGQAQLCPICVVWEKFTL